MFVKFYNDSNQLAKIVINQQTVYVQPKQFASIEHNKETSFAFSLECDLSSQVSRGKYILSIKSDYACDSHVQDISFKLVREKVHVDSNVYYERLLVAKCDFECRLISCEVLDTAEVIRCYERKRMIRFLFVEPIECFTELVAFMVVLGGLLFFCCGWKVAAISFLVLYLLIIMLNWATSLANRLFSKKLLHLDDEKTEFYRLLEPEYITKFFLKTNRAPGM